MLETVFGGHGTIGNDIFASGPPSMTTASPSASMTPKGQVAAQAAGHEICRWNS